jgi:hypothetical protein
MGSRGAVMHLLDKPVWMVFPTRNVERARHTCRIWNAAGYQTLALCEMSMDCVGATSEVHEAFQGYWMSSNAHIRSLADSASMVVLAADDLEPERSVPPRAIAAQFYDRFGDGYGVLQPVGDDKDGMDGCCRICGSPWFGRAWILEAYGGRGPCPLPYRHFYGDEELHETSKAQGVLWQRPDLAQKHNHWCRKGGPPRTDYQKLNSDNWWDKDKAIFMERKAAGFPGSARHVK